MTAIKTAADITMHKVLAATAALASLTAIISTSSICFIWFHQPQMPASLRQSSDSEV